MGLGLSNPTHIALVVVAILLLFGARRLPEVGRSLGLGLREFKDSLTGSDASRRAAVTAGEGPATLRSTAADPADADREPRA